MGTLLGSPYKRGKADIVGTYKLAGAESGTANQLEEGIVVSLSDDSEHVAVGGTPLGVTGAGRGKVSVAVVEAAEKVWAQADNNIGTPVVGANVFVTPAGKIIDTAGDNSENAAIAGVFASAEVRNDGVVTNIKGAEAYNRKCVCISFLGGM